MRRTLIFLLFLGALVFARPALAEDFIHRLAPQDWTQTQSEPYAIYVSPDQQMRLGIGRTKTTQNPQGALEQFVSPLLTHHTPSFVEQWVKAPLAYFNVRFSDTSGQTTLFSRATQYSPEEVAFLILICQGDQAVCDLEAETLTERMILSLDLDPTETPDGTG